MLVYNLILQAILLFYLEVLELLLLFILLLYDFRLLRLFTLRLEDGLLDFSLFILTLLSVGVVVLSGHLLVFVCHLILKNFLDKGAIDFKPVCHNLPSKCDPRYVSSGSKSHSFSS